MKRRDAKQRIHKHVRIAREFLGASDFTWGDDSPVHMRLFRIYEAVRHLVMANRLIDWLEENERGKQCGDHF